MTDKNYAHLSVLVDRSGSMANIANDAAGGVNAFIADQARQPGRCTLTLAEFDTGAGWGRPEGDWFRVVHHGAINTAPTYALAPRGGTPLYDAVAALIDHTGHYLRRLPEHRRPGAVVFVVQTDGEENSSRHTPLETLRAKITEQETRYGWRFVFLGSGLNVAREGVRMGVPHHSTTNVGPGGQAIYTAYMATSQNVNSYRGQTMATGTAPTIMATASNVREDGTVETDDDRNEVKP